MAAEHNPYFEPYLRSATPTGHRSDYHAYPSPQPQHTPGASQSQYDFHQNGFPTPGEHGALLSQGYPPPQHPYGAYTPQRPGTPSSIKLDPAVGQVHAVPLWSSEKTPVSQKKKKGKRVVWIAVAIVVVIVVIIAIVIAIRKKNNGDDADGDSSSGSQNGSGTKGGSGGNVLLAGGDGSMVTTEDGGQFMYNNTFGGNWLFDPAAPFSNGGKANSWTPAINESWSWGEDQIQGVNLGGWLVLEPFISPAIFEKYSAQHAADEWTLHTAMKADTTTPGGGVSVLENHYKTFITERDFAEIAGAGLNWVRIPLACWAIEVYPEEPFVEKISWTYFLKAIEWARKYGLRINLDFHAVPGSQNGWNHSGRLLRSGNWLKTPMGVANAQRTLSYIRTITQFITQEQYANVVPFFGIVNEPYTIGVQPLEDFYLQAYNIIRSVTGVGKGPVMSIFDERPNLPQFASAQFLNGADRVALDIHPYFAFGEQVQAAPETYAPGACTSYGPGVNRTWINFGIIAAGEWSLAINDCGKWVSQSTTIKYEQKFGAGACAVWDNYEAWTPEVIAGMTTLWKAQADVLGNWFFWTWKIGASSLTNKIEAPFWSYQLGLERGWIPKDPRVALGACAAAGAPQTIPRPSPAQMQPWMIGSAAAAAPSNTAGLVWPPAALADQANAAILPQYTPTGTLVTLPVPTFTDPADPKKTLDAGSGWFNDQDSTDGMYVPKSGCTYPPAWSAFGVPVPTQCP